MGDDKWDQIRRDLIDELKSNKDEYTALYEIGDRVKELIHILSYFKSNPSFNHWTTMPDMGHLIASKYDLVLMHISKRQCLTFLPLRSKPPHVHCRKVISIGFVNDNHFVKVL